MAAVGASADFRTDRTMRAAVAACLGEDDAFVKQCWADIQSALGALRRSDALSKLYSLTPMIARLGGEAAPRHAFTAVERVTRWWS